LTKTPRRYILVVEAVSKPGWFWESLAEKTFLKESVKGNFPPGLMKIKIRTNRLIYIIDLAGNMELADSNLLKELVLKMIEKKVERIVLNVEKISSLDSNGIGAFIYISSTLKKLKVSFAIANVRGSVKEVIEKIRLSAYFPIYADLRSAIRELSKNQGPA
jgi:anti-sigma B factor antagonist